MNSLIGHGVLVLATVTVMTVVFQCQQYTIIVGMPKILPACPEHPRCTDALEGLESTTQQHRGHTQRQRPPYIDTWAALDIT